MFNWSRQEILDPFGRPVIFTRRQRMRAGLTTGALLILALGLWAIQFGVLIGRPIVRHFQ